MGPTTRVAKAFIDAEAYCSKHEVGESWRKVKGKVLDVLQGHHVDKVKKSGVCSLEDLITLSRDFTKLVHKAVIESADVASIAADLAVRCRL